MIRTTVNPSPTGERACKRFQEGVLTGVDLYFERVCLFINLNSKGGSFKIKVDGV